MPLVYIKIDGQYTQAVNFYRKDNKQWSSITQSEMLSYMNNNLLLYGGEILSSRLEIAAPASVSSESCVCIATLNSVPFTGATWSITSGSEYASIDTGGTLTINSIADNSTITIQATYLSLTATHTMTVTYVSGSSTETIVDTVTDESGNTTTTTTTTTENADGSSTETSTTVVTDESGNTIGSTESETNTNSDGSYNSSTVNYDENGNPTEGTNMSGDTSGNINTQEVEYNESGTPVVIGYDINTENSDGEGKDITGDGVNTEFVPFQFQEGFTMHIRFKSIASEQPRPPLTADTEDTGTNYLYNIFSAKSTIKVNNIWPGFDMRWAVNKTNASSYSFQFRRTLVGETSSVATDILSRHLNNVYDFIVTFDPSEASRKFSLHDNLAKSYALSLNKQLQDNMDLEVTLGYALNMQGEPYRHSTVTIYDFSINRLNSALTVSTPVISCDGTNVEITCATQGANVYYRTNNNAKFDLYTSAITISADTTVYAYAIAQHKISEVANMECIYDDGAPDAPAISCDGQLVTITCATHNATIYYKMNDAVIYSIYTEPISISATTTVYAYSEFSGLTSNVVSGNCIYDSGIDDPVIYCDGQHVTIVCETPSVDIYYSLGSPGNYSAYTESIAITANTVVYAYAELNGATSNVVSQNCIYIDAVEEPVISCDGQLVSITCATPGATIYYKEGQDGTYAQYTEPFAITANTLVYSYATFNGMTSTVANEVCEYNPVHDYSQDYLTFRVLSGGTIAWNSFGSGYNRVIQYSKNNGEWTSITASTATTISVSDGDIVRFKGTNNTYAGSKSNYDGFDGGTAYFNIEGNIMSLVYGDNFVGQTGLTGTYNFCSIFKQTNVISAENLILPATTLTNYCYRAMFSKATDLISAPELPATTLAQGCYWYMFENCPITTAPDLPATTLVRECYGYMFTGCSNLNHIRCMAVTGFTAASALTSWVNNVAATGTFIKDANTTWTRGTSGIPNGWIIVDDGAILVDAPVITCDGEEIEITCDTTGADIYYRLNLGNYTQYLTAITITANTTVDAYAVLQGQSSITVNQVCEYLSSVPFEASNRDLTTWTYDSQTVTTPYSVNAIDGHSSSYAKGTFNFETSFTLREAQPTYLWFQHADQSASVYIDDTLVEKHWGGYTAFFVDITNSVHTGTNNLKVGIKNNEGNNLAPAYGDFNFNATLGNVKLFTSPYLPDMSYGYDGFHVTSQFSFSDEAETAATSATISVKTSIPTGATVVCTIDSGNTNIYTASSASTGSEMTFTTPPLTGSNLHLWNGTIDPFLYTITLEIYDRNNVLYHRYQRGYGLRFYKYLINDTTKVGTAQNPFTGFLLNGSHYLLRGCCMHDDIEGKANALNDADYAQQFNIIQELNLNFLRLAHYPHPKEVYDWCDRLGIIVQTEGPCVNKMQSTMPTAYFNNLTKQYTEMVQQHFNHPSILFWGLSNETTTDDKDFAKAKIEGYVSTIKAIDQERWVGYVMSASWDDPYGYYNSPSGIDWLGCNLYVGWYSDTNSNNPTTKLNTRVTKTITNKGKALAYSEYGCGGTQACHSDDFLTTTTRGNHERHDIEYQMWLHEGHIAAIRNFPQLLFTAQWQLFDIAVYNRNEGYIVCSDGTTGTTTTDDNLRRLNNKGLVERDHITKKDTFYLYKAEWNPTPFIHICGKDYKKMVSRVIKCYTNESGTFTLKVNGTTVTTATPTNHILEFTAQDFSVGDVVRVEGPTTNDTFTFTS